MAQPTVKNVRPIDPVLTNLSIGFKNERFLWDKLAPAIEVSEKSGTYFNYTRDFWFRRQEGAERAAEGPYQRVGFGVGTSTYSTIEYGFEKLLGDVVIASSQTPDSLEQLSIAFLTNLIQLELEKLVSAATFVSGKWGTDKTLTGTGQWSDFANSDPIADFDLALRTVRRNTGAKPNTVFMGLLGWEKLKEHPLILDKYKHVQTAILTEELVAAALGISELIVGDSVENTAAEGASYVGADIWTDNAVILVRNNPGLFVANGASTFVWNERDNVPWAAENYREEKNRSEVHRVFSHYDPQIVSKEHGYMLLDLVA